MRNADKLLTPTVAIHLGVADAADAAAQGHQPVSVSPTVQLGRVPFFCILHTRAPHFHQRGRVRVWHRVWKYRQVPHRRRAAFVEHLTGEQNRGGQSTGGLVR